METIVPEVPSTPSSGRHPHFERVRHFGSALAHFFNEPMTDAQQERRELLCSEIIRQMEDEDSGVALDFPLIRKTNTTEIDP